MKKYSVRLLLAALGLVLLSGAFPAASAASEDAASIRRYETAEPVTSVVVSAQNTNVIFQQGESDTICVDTKPDAVGEYSYTFSMEDGRLTIHADAVAPGTYGQIGPFPLLTAKKPTGYRNTMTITLPSKTYHALSAEVKNFGSVTFRDVSANTITADTPGSIHFDHTAADIYQCKTNIGGIRGTLTGRLADYTITANSGLRLSNLNHQTIPNSGKSISFDAGSFINVHFTDETVPAEAAAPADPAESTASPQFIGIGPFRLYF